MFKFLVHKKFASGKEIGEALGISRQAVNKHLKKLVQAGKVVKRGSTRSAKYIIATVATKSPAVQKLSKRYERLGLEEDRAFNEIDLRINLKRKLPANVFEIVRYAFTEMLNNVIEHSNSPDCTVSVEIDQYRCGFRIRDFGIGIFYSIFTKFNLLDESAAIGEVVKGKRTTRPEQHTGEGVFFTSKSGDTVIFRSHRTGLVFDNIKQDIFLEKSKFLRGTEIYFSISRHSKRRLASVFSQYAPEEFEYNFEKTRVFVKLLQNQYTSRSEAKRLLVGLDQFKVIILDFKGVNSIGQGFTDEIFRVFKRSHPDIMIEVENLNSILEPMIKHVVDNKF